ncbi:MAG: DnaB-like helicase C-terminal domain-containing protein [Verrucomicrobiales bacterium]
MNDIAHKDLLVLHRPYRDPEVEFLRWIIWNADRLDKWPRIRATIQPEYLVIDAHRKIFELALDRNAKGCPVTLSEIAEHLDFHDDEVNLTWRMIIGMEEDVFIATTDYGPLPEKFIEMWIREIQRIHQQRQARHALSLLQTRAGADELTTQDIAEQMRAIQGLTTDHRDTSVTTSEAVSQAIDDIEAAVAGNAGPIISTGFPSIDAVTNGYQPGELWLVGARPSIGKTAASIAMIHAATESVPALYVTLETSEKKMALRYMSFLSGVPVVAMQRGQLNKSQIQSITMHTPTVSARSILWRNGVADKTHTGIMAWITDKIRERQAKVVFIDYLGLIRHQNSRLDKRLQIDEITSDLKHLAIQHEVTVVLLAQLRRDADNTVPEMSHLKESSGIEADADRILLIHRPNKKENPHENIEDCQIIIEKNRDGETGWKNIKFSRKNMRFFEQEK